MWCCEAHEQEKWLIGEGCSMISNSIFSFSGKEILQIVETFQPVFYELEENFSYSWICVIGPNVNLGSIVKIISVWTSANCNAICFVEFQKFCSQMMICIDISDPWLHECGGSARPSPCGGRWRCQSRGWWASNPRGKIQGATSKNTAQLLSKQIWLLQLYSHLPIRCVRYPRSLSLPESNVKLVWSPFASWPLITKS